MDTPTTTTQSSVTYPSLHNIPFTTTEQIYTSLRTPQPQQRVSYTEALALYRHAPLLHLGMLAQQRQAIHHSVQAPITFVIDKNVNYTNICNVDCMFFAFYRHEEDQDAYVLPYNQLAEKAQALVDAGGTQFLMQGGVNPKLPFDYYTDLLQKLKKDFPTLTLHCFSTSEISWMAHITQQPVQWVLQELIKAGLSSIPGAGAEILHDDIRKKISPKKVSGDDWLHVMEEAHKLGLKTSATMMFGHVEEDWHIIDHLIKIRTLQDHSQGFTAFIPWLFQAPHTKLQNIPITWQGTATDYLRVLAISRIVLDNIPNIQSSWLTPGAKLGQVGLYFGANDMGGLVLEENVVTEAGVKHERKSTEDFVKLIQETGKRVAQRDTQYRVLREWR
ncbi:MAG: cyclic dehypoxanthinyl futalosine synthase [Vampirovibrionales bacterium]